MYNMDLIARLSFAFKLGVFITGGALLLLYAALVVMWFGMLYDDICATHQVDVYTFVYITIRAITFPLRLLFWSI
jgi:hypothetical protein